MELLDYITIVNLCQSLKIYYKSYIKIYYKSYMQIYYIIGNTQFFEDIFLHQFPQQAVAEKGHNPCR